MAVLEMMRTTRSLAPVLATLTPLAAIATGEWALQYDDNNRSKYAKQHLLEWSKSCTTASESDSNSRETGASAWLGSAPPKFPYLLSVSAGDNPDIVSKALLAGANVLGSHDKSTSDTLRRLTKPVSIVEAAIHKVATKYVELKSSLHGTVPADFDPRAGSEASAEEKMMDAILAALREFGESEEVKTEENDEENEANVGPDCANVIPVFFLRDFDALSEQAAERWLRWTHQLTNQGLAHVVLLTTSTVSPSRVQWLQTRHQRGLETPEKQDFVAILLRPAHSLVDFSTAEGKLRVLSDKYKLHLFPATESGSELVSTVDNDAKGRESASDAILKATGNWWSDIDGVCQRLKKQNLQKVALHEERVAIIHKVCEAYLQDREIELLKMLNLDGSMQLKDPTADGVHSTPTNESVALSALEAWKCLEILTDVTPVTGGMTVMGSPQQLLQQKNDDKPLNCVNPVEALLPFNYREEGEQKFLDMIDRQVLFLRPNDAVEISVIPCKNAALVSPCWIQIRPIMKKAFAKIHRNDAYFRVILELERFAANTEMRKEVDLYEKEIAERRQFLRKSNSEFAILQFTMTPAEKSQRKAELALIEVELQAKDVYLDKLRSLLSP